MKGRGPTRPKQPLKQITSVDQLPLLCTADEAARLLRCTVDQVQKKARSGELPGFKGTASTAWLFRREKLFEYIEKLEKKGTHRGDD